MFYEEKKLKGLLSLWLAVVLVMVTATVPVRAEGSHGKHSSESGWQDLCKGINDLNDSEELKRVENRKSSEAEDVL